MGIPKLLTTDQGSEFKNHINDEMMQLLKIKHRDNEGSRDEMSAGAKRHHVPSKEDEACCTESKECH